MVTDDDGVGFNDTTPVAPVGGNSGRTLGEQRRNALQHAADLWGQALDSEVPVVIEAEFKALGCADPDGATLAYAGTTTLETGLDGGGANPNWSYVAALADRLMGEDLHPGEPDIGATFNLDVDAGCLGDGIRWYYGLDSKQGDDVDFVNVALHELGHGLGVHDLTVHETGAFLGGLPNPYAAHVLDLETGKHWHEMSDQERVESMTHTRRLVWDGPRVTAAAPQRLAQGSPRVQVTPDVARVLRAGGRRDVRRRGARDVDERAARERRRRLSARRSERPHRALARRVRAFGVGRRDRAGGRRGRDLVAALRLDRTAAFDRRGATGGGADPRADRERRGRRAAALRGPRRRCDGALLL